MKNSVIIGSSLTVLILIGLITGFVIFYVDLTPESILNIPSTCSIDTTGATSGVFGCPSDSSLCSIELELLCSNKVSDQQVVFRGSSQTGLPSSIAIDSNNDGSLEAYTRSASTISSNNFPNSVVTLPEPFQSNYVFVYNNAVYIYQNGKGYKYNNGGTISTQPTPRTGESCDGSSGFIRCSGDTNSYICSEQSTGSKIVEVTYAGSTSGTATKQTTLTGGQTIGWDGKINYIITKTQESECTNNVKASDNSYYACIQDIDGCGVMDYTQEYTCGSQLYNEQTGQCQEITTCTAQNGVILNRNDAVCLDQYTLERCTNPPTTTREYVQIQGDICEDGEIKSAYDVNVEVNKLIIAEGEYFEIDLTLSGTENNKNIPVTARIKNTAVSQSRLTGSSYFNAGQASFSLLAPSQGFYTIEIFMEHPNGDYTKEYQVQVTSGLSLNLYADSNVQFDNEPITVQLEAYKGGEKKRLSDYNIDATFNGRTVFPQSVEPVGKDLRFYFDLTGDGILRVRARGSDETGLTTDFTNYLEVSIKETGIEIQPDFKSGVCAGTIKNTFKTRDSTGNLIDTTSSVLIKEPTGGGIKAVTSNRISLGTYEFSYNYEQNGLYVIEVTVTADGLGTYELNDGLGQSVNILTGSTCGTGGTGGEEAGTNLLLYAIVGIFILGIGGFVYLLFFRKR